MEDIEDYRSKLREIADYSFNYGFKKYKIAHPDFLEIGFTNDFHIACAEGFKIAQKLLICEVMTYQDLFSKKNIELKEVRRRRNLASEKIIKKEIRDVEQRLHNYYHIADGIAWQLLGCQIHVARRLNIGQRANKILISSNIASSIKVADKINEAQNSFALISDLTSFVQIGDLLVRSDNKISIIELKEGKINKEIKDYLNDFESTSNEISEDDLKSRFDTNTVKQVQRIQRQNKRAERAIDVINNDKGVDPRSEKQIFVHTPKINTVNYHDVLRKLHVEIKEKIWAYNVVDNCLHIGMYRDEGRMMAPFAIRNILKAQTSNFFVVDFLSITNNLSEPIFAKPFPPDFIIDILTERVKIILGLNVDSMIELFNSCGLSTRLLTPKETAIINQKSKGSQLTMINKRGIAIKSKLGKDMTLSGGIFSKIFFDSILPSNIAQTFLSIDYDKEL